MTNDNDHRPGAGLRALILAAAATPFLLSSATSAHTPVGVVDFQGNKLLTVPGQESEIARFPRGSKKPTFRLMIHYKEREDCPDVSDDELWDVWPDCQERDLCIFRIEVARDKLPYLESNGGFYMPHGAQTVYVE